ncbi:hypothetical protein D1BOALGB6SA_2795 [Olavius sp. associated proteobacterium Delta 1]|nr:hypothetical protein D1BOALGB6SA_2795 [Olavius sp. associated proteobacterium Delta 1]
MSSNNFSEKIEALKRIIYPLVILLIGIIAFVANFSTIHNWFTTTVLNRSPEPNALAVGVSNFYMPSSWHLLGKKYLSKKQLFVSEEEWDKIVSLTARYLIPEGYIHTGKKFIFEMYCKNQSDKHIIALRDRIKCQIIKFDPFEPEEKIVVVPEPTFAIGGPDLFRYFEISLDKPQQSVDGFFFGKYVRSLSPEEYEMWDKRPTVFKKGYLKIYPQEQERIQMTVNFRGEGDYTFRIGFEWSDLGQTFVSWSEPIRFFATSSILPAHYSGLNRRDHWPDKSERIKLMQVQFTGVKWID